MKLPKRPSKPIEFSIEAAGDALFTLKPLACDEYDNVTDLLTAEKRATALRLACRYGLAGWSGIEEEFSRESWKTLDPQWAYELGGKILEISSLTESEKNS